MNRLICAFLFVPLLPAGLAVGQEVKHKDAEMSFTECISRGKQPNQDMTFCFDENTGERAVFSNLPEPLNSCQLQLLPSDLHDALKPGWSISKLSVIGMSRCMAHVGASKTNDPGLIVAAAHADEVYAGVKSGNLDAAEASQSLSIEIKQAADNYNAKLAAASACPASGVTFVMPYVRSNGTVVRGHLRSNPDGLDCNNLKQ
jgi:hypothetical protein